MDKLIRKIQFECPICGLEHEVEERTRETIINIKGEDVSYQEIYYMCLNEDEENEFVPAKIFNENLLKMRDAYRKKMGLLTSLEIVQIRENYGLTQSELSCMLGWGEVTVCRYESKSIQDEAYDNILKIVRDNPLKAYEFLEKNRSRFTNLKFITIKEKIINKLDEYGKEFLKRQSLESEYIKYTEPSDFNGYISLNIDKLESIISYIATKINNLYKVKLMKLLWYIDFVAYKRYSRGITGLVYEHEQLGALPKSHYKIIDLENVKVEEEYDDEYTKYHIIANNRIDFSSLNSNELEIIDEVIIKFKNYNSKQIVDYMHDEKAYKETCNKQIIPYSFAKELNEF